jgi:hypothetical protein
MVNGHPVLHDAMATSDRGVDWNYGIRLKPSWNAISHLYDLRVVRISDIQRKIKIVVAVGRQLPGRILIAIRGS